MVRCGDGWCIPWPIDTSAYNVTFGMGWFLWHCCHCYLWKVCTVASTLHQSCFFVALTPHVGSEAGVFDRLSLGYMSWLSVSQLSVAVTNAWDKLTYKEGKFIFDSQFQRFQSTVTWLVAFGPVVREHIMVESMWQRKLLTSMEARKQKGDKRNQVPIFPWKGMLPVINFD